MSNPEPSDETALTIFGRRVRSLREEQGYSLRGFAEKTGIQRSHLSEIENGKVNVTLDTLLCLADALDLQVSQLLHPLDTRRELYHASRKV
ncbi:MAG: helix-turn-helix domain-containing protein [Candidatus Tectomicrobia bacterium]|nr:helix-turn-helix domain-containing protein [Candidatus Tectomicrobia bacterium]